MGKPPVKTARRSLQALTLDVGGTLIHPWPSVGDVYAEVAAEYGFRGLEGAQLTRNFIAAWKQEQNFGYLEQDWARLVKATFGDLIPRGASDTFFPALYSRFTEARSWQVDENVRPLLDELRRRKIPVGIISNWDDRLRDLLQNLELAESFQAIAISCEVGRRKPARLIFASAARQLGLPPEAILHVGDSRDMDYDGALAAGFQAALLDRAAPSAFPKRIASLAEVPRFFEYHGVSSRAR
jgi:putative hydrolase of the HAD superfamily